MEGRFVSYLRVSTAKQGINGLGIEAQRQAISNYLNGGKWILIKEYVEQESGRRADNRPMLKAALETCQRTRATLLIARLDRLSRNVAFIANLLDSGVQFVAVDNPHANTMTLQILSVMAQYEREVLSKRTKAALAAARSRGVSLGSPAGLSREAMQKGRGVSVMVRKAKADEYAKRMHPIIMKCRSEGMSLHAIARRLTADKELTPRGKELWDAGTVRQVIIRVEKMSQCSELSLL